MSDLHPENPQPTTESNVHVSPAKVVSPVKQASPLKPVQQTLLVVSSPAKLVSPLKQDSPAKNVSPVKNDSPAKHTATPTQQPSVTASPSARLNNSDNTQSGLNLVLHSADSHLTTPLVPDCTPTSGTHTNGNRQVSPVKVQEPVRSHSVEPVEVVHKTPTKKAETPKKKTTEKKDKPTTGKKSAKKVAEEVVVGVTHSTPVVVKKTVAKRPKSEQKAKPAPKEKTERRTRTSVSKDEFEKYSNMLNTKKARTKK
jgi:hypothetical protein